MLQSVVEDCQVPVALDGVRVVQPQLPLVDLQRAVLVEHGLAEVPRVVQHHGLGEGFGFFWVFRVLGFFGVLGFFFFGFFLWVFFNPTGKVG